MSRAISIVTLFSALGCGLIGGVFFAFSTFIMPALGRIPAAQGIAAMQSINVAVINRWFLAAFMGTALICLVLAGSSIFTWAEPGARLRLAGCLAYLIGTILVTFAFNIPRNDALDAVAPDSAEAAGVWAAYLVEWTRWNSARSIGALVAAALLILAHSRT